MVNPTHQTRAESLAASLDGDIRERKLGSGDYIGTMDELREQTRYAKSTVSEAVRLLRDRGIIEIRPGRNGGLFVSAPNPVVRLRHTLLTVSDSASTVADAIVVREALEPGIDTDAARHRTSKDITDLRRLVTVLKKSNSDTDKFMRANWALHERIAEITPNHLLKAVYLGCLKCVAEMSAHAEVDDPSQEQEYVSERIHIHVELVDAIIEGDIEKTLSAVTKHAGLSQNIRPTSSRSPVGRYSRAPKAPPAG